MVTPFHEAFQKRVGWFTGLPTVVLNILDKVTKAKYNELRMQLLLLSSALSSYEERKYGVAPYRTHILNRVCHAKQNETSDEGNI